MELYITPISRVFSPQLPIQLYIISKSSSLTHETFIEYFWIISPSFSISQAAHHFLRSERLHRIPNPQIGPLPNVSHQSHAFALSPGQLGAAFWWMNSMACQGTLSIPKWIWTELLAIRLPNMCRRISCDLCFLMCILYIYIYIYTCNTNTDRGLP